MPNYIIASSPQAQGGNLHCYHLPKGMLNIQLGKFQIDGETLYEFLVTPHIIPDPAHRYFIRYKKNIWANDLISIQFSNNGFLSSISRTEPESSQPALNQTTNNGQPSSQLQHMPVFETTFDPFEEDILAALNHEFGQLEDGMKLEIVYDKGDAPVSPPDLGASSGGLLYCGVLCRVPTVLHIKLSYRDRELHRMVKVPHPDWLHLVEIPPQISSAGDFHMQFDEWGYPTSIQISKASLWAKLTDAPLTLAKKIMEIPGQIFRLRIDTATNQKALIDSQMVLAQAQHKQALASEALTAASKEAEEARKQADETTKNELKSLQSQLFDLIQDKNRLEAMSIPIGKDMDAFDVKLQVLRYSSAKESTLGLLFDISEKRKFLAFTLEDEYREEKVKHETRIPAGTYAIQFRTEGGFHSKYLKKFKSPFHKGMLHLQNVPGFEYILIHGGNDDDDTSGCLLVGNDAKSNVSGKSKGKILDSVQAYKKIYPPIADALEAGKSVGIEYIDYDSVE